MPVLELGLYQQPQIFPCRLPHYPELTGSRYKKALINHRRKALIKSSYLLTRSRTFDVLLDLEILEPYLPTLFMKKDKKKHDNVAILTITTFMTDRQKYIWTWRLYYQPGPEV